jgi:hypothetical protein
MSEFQGWLFIAGVAIYGLGQVIFGIAVTRQLFRRGGR